MAPKVGNIDQIHGFQVDLLVNTYRNRGKGLRLDVMDYIWNEMTLVCTMKRVPAFCPYVWALIMDKSKVAKAVVDTLRLVQHKPKGLIIKNHVAPPGAPQDVEMDPSLFGDDGTSTRPARSRRGSRKGKVTAQPEVEVPGWAKRLENIMKKTFCLTNDVNKRQYQAHRREKLNRQDFIAHRRHHGEEVQSGTEGGITSEEKWLSRHRNYYEVDVSSPRREPSSQRQTTRRARSSRPSYAESSDNNTE